MPEYLHPGVYVSEIASGARPIEGASTSTACFIGRCATGRPFRPTLITTGTRELFLSDCARLSTRMRLAGVDARLHVWEGMWHTFEWYLELPEAQGSLDEIADFIGTHSKRG